MADANQPNIVFVGNLHAEATEDTVRIICECAGPVKGVRLVREKGSQLLKGYAFVEYYDSSCAEAAVGGLDGTVVGGLPLTVSPASEALRNPAAFLIGTAALGPPSLHQVKAPRVSKWDEGPKWQSAASGPPPPPHPPPVRNPWTAQWGAARDDRGGCGGGKSAASWILPAAASSAFVNAAVTDEYVEQLRQTMKMTAGKVRSQCRFGRECKNVSCMETHTEVREIEENPHIIICKFGRACKRSTCFYVHPIGRIIDDDPDKGMCMHGLNCENPQCFFIHPAGWQYTAVKFVKEEKEVKTVLRLHIDELLMPDRPQVIVSEMDREVWVDPLPDPEHEKAWLDSFGPVAELFRLEDHVTGEPTDRGYVRFKTHAAALSCTETGAGVWSESERIIKSKDWGPRSHSTYFVRVSNMINGKNGETLKCIRDQIEADQLYLQGEGVAGGSREKKSIKSSRLHFVCKGYAKAHSRLQPALEALMATVHEQLAERLREELENPSREAGDPKTRKRENEGPHGRARPSGIPPMPPAMWPEIPPTEGEAPPGVFIAPQAMPPVAWGALAAAVPSSAKPSRAAHLQTPGRPGPSWPSGANEDDEDEDAQPPRKLRKVFGDQ